MTTAKDKTPDPRDFCLVAKAIYIGNDDVLTDKTAEQIYTHDCTGQRLCGWGGKRAAEVCSRNIPKGDQHVTIQTQNR